MEYQIEFFNETEDYITVKEYNIVDGVNIFVPDIESVMAILKLQKEYKKIQEIYSLFINQKGGSKPFAELIYDRNSTISNNFFAHKSLDKYFNFFLNSQHSNSNKNNNYKTLIPTEERICFLMGHFLFFTQKKIISPNIRYNKLLADLSFVKIKGKRLDTFEKRKKYFGELYNKNWIYHEVDMKAFFIQFLDWIFNCANITHKKFEDYKDLEGLLENSNYSREFLKKLIPQQIASILKGKIYVNNELGEKFELLKEFLAHYYESLKTFDIRYDELDDEYKQLVYLKNLYFYNSVFYYVLSKKSFFNPYDLILFGDSFGFLSKHKVFQIKNLKLAHSIKT